ncbi:MAG: FtsX-like permease family protein [Flavobacteriia bacterium]|nr:FtsX-like permease family protein [Flavobacteriia bacterium]
MSNKQNKGIQTGYVSTVIGISLILFMIGIVLSGYFALTTIQKQAKESLQGDVFFKIDVTEPDMKQIAVQMSSWNEFKEVFFVSSERAMDDFSDNTNQKEEIRDIFEGTMPLPPSLRFQPKEKFANKKGMKRIKEKLMNSFLEEIDEVHYDESSVEKVNLGFKQFVFLFLVIAFFLLIVAVAMINNTIRLALFSKRFTIKTMQLVGANASFIRKPFLFQSLIQGFMSSIIGFSLLCLLFYALNSMLKTIEIPLSLQDFLFLFAILLLLGLIIAFLSTYFSLNRYLRKKLDQLY